MRRITLLLAAASCAAACTPATLEAAYVPNPVLLGPVDRVGGHRAVDTKTLQQVEVEVEDFVSVTTKSKEVGGQTVTTQTTIAIHEGSGLVTAAVLDGTQGRPERDVRIDEIPAGAWAVIAPGSAMASRWVGLRGHVVEVRHDR